MHVGVVFYKSLTSQLYEVVSRIHARVSVRVCLRVRPRVCVFVFVSFLFGVVKSGSSFRAAVCQGELVCKMSRGAALDLFEDATRILTNTT